VINFSRKKVYAASVIFLFVLISVIASGYFLWEKAGHSGGLSSPVVLEEAAPPVGPELSGPPAGTPAKGAPPYARPAVTLRLALRSLLPADSLLNAWNRQRSEPADREALRLSEAPQPAGPGAADADFAQQLAAQGQLQSPLLPGTEFSGQMLVMAQAGLALSDGPEPGLPLSIPDARLVINPLHPRYCFPVSWPFTFRDSYGEPRGPTRRHIGIDIFATEGTEVYAITDGVVKTLANWERAGLTVLLQGQDAKGYVYMHLQRYAPNLHEGQRVKKGEVIAYVGRTGTTTSAPHLHFQVHYDHGFAKDSVLNPYDALVSLCQGRGVADLGRPKLHLAHLTEGRGKVYTLNASRPDIFLAAQESPPGRRSPLVWQVPRSNWKVARPMVQVEDPKARTGLPTHLTWVLPTDTRDRKKPRILIPHYPRSKN
jgi:murein DD-endopeptidase MepM/ murein hydrolase activator NlpD